MPKLKTNRGAAKRFRKTGAVASSAGQSFRNHILTKKSTKRKRHLREHCRWPRPMCHAVRRLLPYS